MDLDGDGALSMYELAYFCEEQCQKLDNMAIEPLPFEDCLCQMLDLVKPQYEGNKTLFHSVTPAFLEKELEHHWEHGHTKNKPLGSHLSKVYWCLLIEWSSKDGQAFISVLTLNMLLKNSLKFFNG